MITYGIVLCILIKNEYENNFFKPTKGKFYIKDSL